MIPSRLVFEEHAGDYDRWSDAFRTCDEVSGFFKDAEFGDIFLFCKENMESV